MSVFSSHLEVRKRPASISGTSQPRSRKKESEQKSDEFTMKRLDVFHWAQRICERLKSKGICGSPFHTANIYTEFSGSTCAESAVETVVRNMVGDKVKINFKSMADIKSNCRKVCAATRKILSFLVQFGLVILTRKNIYNNNNYICCQFRFSHAVVVQI